MKRVAVSQRVDDHPDRGERRDALDQRLAVFLAVAGYLPVPVPNSLVDAACSPDVPADDGLAAWLESIAPLAVVLSGGNDIGACPDRDRTEQRLLEHARRHRLPVLGICRGMQMMGVWAGARLKPVAGHVATRHELGGGFEGPVNSYHAYALDGCPAGFDVLATCREGEIEAIAHAELPWEGWMWHPEREEPFQRRDLERLRTLFA